MKRSRLCLAVLLAAGPVFGGAINGSFETGNLTGWSSTGVVSVVGTDNPGGGVALISPFDGSRMAKLVTGGTAIDTLATLLRTSIAAINASSDTGNAGTSGAAIYQSVTGVLGQSVVFDWNYVEHDYLPFNDWAFFVAYDESQPAGSGVVTRIASLNQIGPGMDATSSGWHSFAYELPSSGTYRVGFGVINAEDNGIQSQLYLDNVHVVPEPGTMLLLAIPLAGFVLRRRARA